MHFSILLTSPYHPAPCQLQPLSPVPAPCSLARSLTQISRLNFPSCRRLETDNISFLVVREFLACYTQTGFTATRRLPGSHGCRRRRRQTSQGQEK